MQLREDVLTRHKCIFVGGLSLSARSLQDSVTAILDAFARRPGHPLVITPVNAHVVVSARKDVRLFAFLKRADFCVADGCSLLLAALALGRSLPERVTGIDLMIRLCEQAALRNMSVYLLGGMPNAAARAANTLRKQYPALNIVGIDRPPFGSEFEPGEAEGIRNRIRSAAPDFLFVCLGVPLQEYWIEQFTYDLPVGVVMGNGAALDVLAGFFVRPPGWVQAIGLEWLYRLGVEPRRLWRRYLIGNLVFIATILKQALLGR